MKSKITNGETEYLFTADVLGKYPVKYYQCRDSGFIQTEDAYWLPEAYSTAITSLDIGLLYRNIKLAGAVEKIISNNFNSDGQFLDYAGGYGIFTRLMRDNGYQFFHDDQFCEDLFAKHFELTNVAKPYNFELVTAFEVFEHLANPLEEIKKIFEYSDSVLFSTELVPDKKIASPNDWWYIVPETGQHIAFYTRKSLEIIGKKLGLTLYSNNANLHLFSKKSTMASTIATDLANPFAELQRPKNSFLKNLFKHRGSRQIIAQRESLLQKDFEYVKRIISKK